MAANGTTYGKPTQTTMKAQQFDARDGKLHLNEIPIPQPKPTEILVKMLNASLCHSDIMPFQGNKDVQAAAKPVTIGHEGTGVVVDMGAEAAAGGRFKVGDEVGFLCAAGSCFECYACRNVHNLWCEKGESRMQGFAEDGYFQEYAAMDWRNAMVLPKEISAREGAPLFCAGVTAFHAIDGLKLPEGKWVVVIGCGGLGHLGIQYAKAMGYRVIGVDITPAALEAAKASGAEHVFNSRTDGADYVKKIVALTGGGADAAVNFTAAKRAYDDMPGMLLPGKGIFMCVGIPEVPIELNVFDIALGKYRVMGASNGQCYNMPKAIEFSAKHGIKPHVEMFKLEQLGDMIDSMLKGTHSGRMSVRFD